MLQRVNQIIVVADFSKIGRENFATIAPLEAVDTLITNRSASREELDSIASMGIDIVTV